ncbi:MAG: Ldh family oxidoreductase [Candidatus Marinimicrobia bacterium]|nr:Ldh family oxidoreductase [Candidatus Neomarinimicrobiota bacterium]
MSDQVKIKTENLRQFTKMILGNFISEQDARITADVLLAADVRGIESHGVARLQRYISGLKQGVILPIGEAKIIKETPVSIVADGQGGMGQPITCKIMEKCIEKARTHFMCFASIRNSNHYGIAGYYTKMALEENMIGISLTNSAPLVLPTFSSEAVIGTNPISIGIPAQKHRPFLLDMATSTVPRGKLEVYARKNKPMPDSWATDEKGIPSVDPSLVLHNMVHRIGGGLLPLGGGGELTGGHKGFGLSAVVDIFSGVLSSGKLGKDVYGEKGKPAGVCHFIGAIHPDAFCGLKEISSNMDDYIDMLKSSRPAEGEDYIYVAGEKEYRNEEKNAQEMWLQDKVFQNLRDLGKEFGLTLPSL